MMIVRVLALIAKPALVGGALTAAVGGSYAGYDHWRGDNVTPFQRIQSHGQQLLISEFGQHADTIVAVDPLDASRRTVIATIDHADGYGIFATLSPDGQAIAYTALPADSEHPTPDTPAHAAVVDVKGNVTLLATDIDLLVPPVWAPDSESIVVRKNVPEEDSAGSFELILLDRDGGRDTITAWRSAAVFPIDFTPDGSKLYFATLNADGTNLYSVATNGSDETLVAHLSDEIARDWRLSPDGSTLAYSIAESGPTPSIVTMTLDLATGEATRATAGDEPRAEFNPTWSADGTLTVSALKPDGGGDAVSVTASGEISALTENDDAIDLPLDWSPDGSTLAVRALDGGTVFEAGESHVELVRSDGTRERVSDSADVLIVGWLE